MKIANCKYCEGVARLFVVGGYAHAQCLTRGCWSGPALNTEEEALAAWNELMGKPAEPAAGSVRKFTSIAITSWGSQVRYSAIADDGTAWWFCGSQSVWLELPPLPQPAEIKGSVE